MSRKHREPDLTDPDNPEWTDADFARAQPPEAFPELAAAIKRGRGRPRAETPKVAVNLRLDANVLAYFKAGGDRWQSRINDVLTREVERELQAAPLTPPPSRGA